MNFRFNSQIAKILIWGALSLVLLIDTRGVWLILTNQLPTAQLVQIFMLFGVCIKVWAYICMIMGKGQIKIPLYIWGGFFIIAGASGILSYLLSAQSEPGLLYLYKLFSLIAGIVIVTISRSFIDYYETQED